jgi:ribose/xylose/arabinose/galactoside ABC-type transport system permease subunit
VLDLLAIHPFFQNVLVGTIIILVVFGSGFSRYRRTVPV